MESLTVPDVEAAADLARIAARYAVDRVAFDDGVVGAEQVDAEQRAANAAIPHRDARRRDVNARGVSAKVAGAAAVDVEAFDDDAAGTNANHAAAAGAAQQRAVATAEHQWPVDDQIAFVHPAVDDDALARLGAIDAVLQRRPIGRGRTALEIACRRPGVVPAL